MYVLGEHNGTKTEFYRNNNKSQGLVPAHFALIIIIVVHVVKHQSVLLDTYRRQDSLRMMLSSTSIYQLNCSYSYPKIKLGVTVVLGNTSVFCLSGC